MKAFVLALLVPVVGCAFSPEPDETHSAPDAGVIVDDSGFPSSGGNGGTTSGNGGTTSTSPPGLAFLHADLWSTWWNDRTRCGAERTFLEMCERRGDDCGVFQQAVAACNPGTQIYGQVGPEKQGEELCQRGKFPAFGGCDASKFDFDALRFYWYGAEWQGNWGWATLKIFDQGADWKGGGELVAYSSLPGKAQAAMAGIQNHGLGYGCTMLGTSSGDDKYLLPFGAFAWIQVPTGKPVTLAAASGTNFADQQFQGCSRGAKTQDPWIAASPGAVLGCVYVLENVVFEPGKHYFLQYGKLTELPSAAPPNDVVSGFALPEVQKNVQSADACKP